MARLRVSALSLVLALFLVSLLSACRLASPQPPSPVAPAAQAVPTAAPPASLAPPSVGTAADPAFSGERALRLVEHLATTIGPRPAGSMGYSRAAEWAAEQFRAMGYRVERQAFSFDEFRVRRLEARIVSPAPAELEAVAMTNSGSGEVTAPLVHAGLGRDGELPAEVAGAIALIERGQITFQEKVERATLAGAVGVIVYNNEAGFIQPSLAQAASVPAVLISRDDGRRLVDQARAGRVIASLVVDAQPETIRSENVIASRPGSGESILVVGGHLDSVEGSPGANDNASGSAVTLELARVMAGVPTSAELRFILFGAEENGLFGSRAYVQRLTEAERARIVGMINLDMVGIDLRLSAAGAPRLSTPAREKAAELGRTLPEVTNAGGGSDHASFSRAGVPTIFFFTGIDENYHKPTDQAHLVQPETLQLVGEIALHVLKTVAG
ncbi:MAG: aminopeptidase [Dehalococcoidia bacterium]|nr:MAG: aminopeptidase [Dehalococcoidia bacterium]